MSVSLQKNQSLVLDSSRYDLSNLTIGLGWARKKTKKGLLGFLKSGDAGFDLDAIALLLGRNGKLRHEDDVIYFGNLKSSDQSITHSGDNLTGKHRGDSEQIVVHLNQMSERYHKVTFAVIIHEAKEREQHFGLLENAFVRAMDAAGHEMVRFDLSHDAAYDGEISMLMGDLYRKGGKWEFKAVGIPLDVERISSIAAKYA